MKKFVKFLALCLMACVIVAFSACSVFEEHTAATDWQNDDDNHWHACGVEGCDEKFDSAAHTYDDGTVTTPATEEAEGVKTFKCTVCGYAKTESIAKLEKEEPPVHTHSLTLVDEVPAECEKSGTKAYYTCSGCDSIFADEAGNTEIAVPEIIPAKGHTEVALGESSAPSCTTAGMSQGKYCSNCEEILVPQKLIPATGHSWNEGVITSNATCSTPGEKTVTCGTCGESEKQAIEINPDAHAWNNGIVTKTPTCSAEGEKTYTCQHNAEHTYTESVVIDENAHAWDNGEITTPATCSAEGVKTFKCTLCETGKKQEPVSINSEAHAWDNGEITTPATCTAEGVKTYTCAHNSGHTKTETVEIDENAHSANDKWESDAENHWQICTNGCTTLLNKTTHTPDREEATETDPIKCTVCEYVIAPIKDHQHDFSVAQYDETHHWNKCSGCEAIDEKIEHFGGVATCVAAAVCDTCKQSYGEKNAENHAGLVTQEYQAPTCTEIGYTEGKSCTACDIVFSTREEIPATGHIEEAVHGYAATCTAKGLSDGKRCVVCKAVTVEQVEIEIAPHAWGDPVITIEGNVGTSTYTCANCGTVESYSGPVASEKHVCDHLIDGIENEYSSWTACSVCGAKSYAVEARPLYLNAGGRGSTHTNQPVWNLKEGCADATVISNLEQASLTVTDVSVSYNLGSSGKDKSKSSIDFTFTINAESAMTVNVFVFGRSTNNNQHGINVAAQLNKFMKVYQGDTEIAVNDSAAFPAYTNNGSYYHYSEQQVSTIELAEGANTFTFKFTKEGGTWYQNDAGTADSAKVYGGYISYFRFAEASKVAGSCENNIHSLEKINEVAPTCLADGMKAHYACENCDKLFDLENSVETDAKYLVIPRWNHVFENIARKQSDGTYAYVCTHGCGTTKEHVCTGGTHLIIAREPNKVWYEDGQTFNPDRMEVYLSTACAEGCSGNTVVAGHLSGYEALSYTYQNGDSFKAGDEYITINYTKDDVTYSAQLPVTVTSVGGILTIDDSDEGFTSAEFSIDDGKALAHRTNDQGRVGQSAYGGTYATNFADGDIATFTFTLDEAKENANIVLRAASDRVNGAGGTPPCVYAISVNDVVTIKVDGVVVEFSDDVIFKGSVTNLDQKTNRWVYTNWMNLDLGTYNLGVGTHTVEIIVNNVLPASIASCDSSTIEASIELDCLNVFLGE